MVSELVDELTDAEIGAVSGGGHDSGGGRLGTAGQGSG